MSSYCQMDAEALDRFTMGRVSPQEMEDFEEHLLICEPCQQRFEAAESFAIAMRGASAELLREPEPKRWWAWRFPQLVPAMAAVAMLVIGVVAIARYGGKAPQPIAVSLTAMRGTVPGGTVPAGRPLALTPDLTGIAAPAPYKLEIVDQAGRVTWQANYNPASGAATAAAQSAGPHFVRIYSAAGKLLREYGLTVQ